jgi:hypothetical protein
MLVLGLALCLSQTVLPRAHSHNDYLRSRPLAEALDNGFASVEADVFLVGGKLLVAHERADLDPTKTLEALYLKPLSDRLAKGKGWIYPGERQTFWVLVDVKADGAAAYDALKQLLKRFPRLAYRKAAPAVRFVISGDRPVEKIVADKGAFAALDGRWPDLEKGYSAELMPWVSEAWSTHFTWRSGPFPNEMQNRLRSMVDRVHSQHRRIRFWGAPDTEEMWRINWEGGVDLINTDQPAVLRKWMAGRGQQE